MTGDAMEVRNVLHMSGGDDAHSYARNSNTQRAIRSKVMPMLEETIKTMYAKSFPQHFVVADMGCSSGPNALSPVSIILKVVLNLLKQYQNNNNHKDSTPSHEVLVFLNDLPSNDFNSVFRSLPEIYRELEEDVLIDGSNMFKCFVSAVPGSFYGRLLPRNSLHFVYSFCSLHWLSQVPEEAKNNNKGNICLSKSSPPILLEAYKNQFQTDFSLFLSSRAEELVGSGQMLLLILGRSNDDATTVDCSPYWTMLAKSLLELANEGHIEEDDVDSFGVPFYAPHPEEIKNTIVEQGSFDIDGLQTFETCWVASDPDEEGSDNVFDKHKCAQILTGAIRAATEPMLRYHFGEDTLDMDNLFLRYMRHLGEYLSTVDRPMYFNVVISLTKKEMD